MGDAWGEESQINQIGTAITVLPAILAALLMWGVLPIQVPIGLLFVLVALCGIVGGVINLLGRGPIAIGAVVGLVMALGGFGAVYLWINGRESVRWFEIMVAFLFGVIPGFVLQYVLGKRFGTTA